MSSKVARLCCCCRQLQPVTQMTRVVRLPNGAFVVQGRQHVDGRGAYVCAACRTAPHLAKALNRSFKTPLPLEIAKTISQIQ